MITSAVPPGTTWSVTDTAYPFGSGGQGSSSHLATERLQLATGTRMTHVPYKGLAPALTDLMGGRVELIVVPAGKGGGQ